MGNKVITKVGPKLGIYETDTDTQLSASLGFLREFDDGRKFRLCQNSISVLVPGKFVQGPASNTYDENIPIGTASVGDTTLTVTVHAGYGATVAANDFRDGYFVVSGTGVAAEVGHGRKIKSNTVALVGADTTLTFYDALTDVITASSTGNWVKNQFKDVVIDAGSARAVGVPICDVAASTSTVPVYFWAQVAGPCPCVSGGALVAGDTVETNASGVVITATGGTTAQVVGTAMQVCTDSGDATMIWLNME